MLDFWKHVKGYEGIYWVNTHGQVKSLRKILKPQHNGNGYLYYCLRINGKGKNKYAHRLVADNFIPIRPFEKTEVNHIDGNKHNNYLGNLEWCTRSENAQHAHDNGLIKTPRGEDSSSAKLTEDQVLEIRAIHKSGEMGYRRLSKKYSISQTQIQGIITRKKWKHI